MDILTATEAELEQFTEQFDAARGAAALRELHRFVGRFVCYPSEHAHVAHVLWIAHAHLMEHWHTSPRLALMSEEKESGKTRVLEITEQLVPGALLSFNLSPAALVRKVAEGGHTILYDEIDALFGNAKREENNLDVRSILNSGYKRGAKAYRCVMVGKRVEVEELDSFAPVALAGLRTLPDTLASRAIIIRMRRRAPDEQVEQFRLRQVQPQASAIYQKIATWASSLLDLGDAEPAMPDGVTDRAAECWEPLLLLADAAGGEWPELARKAALHFVDGGKVEATSPGVELLEHVREAFGADSALWTETLLQRLHDRPESPWKDIRGRPLDDRGLAKRLRGFGIRSSDVKLSSTNRKGYRSEYFADAWKRYLPSVSANSATSATELDNQDKKVAPVAEVALVSATSATSATELNSENNKVAEVAEVALVCAQCGGEGGALLGIGSQQVRMHPECRRFWKRAHA